MTDRIADLGALFTSVVKEVVVEEDDDRQEPLELLLPYLVQYGIVNRTVTVSQVDDKAIKELAHRWQLKTKDPKTMKSYKRDDLISLLIDTVVAKSRIANAAFTGGVTMPVMTQEGGKGAKGGGTGARMETSQSLDALTILMPKKKKKIKNYFGLPNYAYASSSSALVYKARKHADEEESSEDIKKRALRELGATKAISSYDELSPTHTSTSTINSKGHGESGHKAGETDLNKNKTASSGGGSNNVAAQRKVAEALVTMARNETMARHFMHKGGAEAVLKLIGDSKDKLVLTNCVLCLLEVSTKPEYCKVLVDKYVLTTMQTVVEKADNEIRLLAVQVLANLTYQSHLCALLVMGGLIPLVQLVMAMVDEHDCVSFCVVCICNVAPILESLQDLELAMKICVQASKQLGIKENYRNALFAVEVFVNLSRCYQYGALLCEEGVLPLLMSMLECHMTQEMIGLISEGLVNLSTTRKNRREISSCGIGLFLDKIFSLGAPDNRADMLSMIGNLLTSGFFHDKMAREETVNTMLQKMLDPKQVKQFVSTAYVISQMAQNDASATVLASCGLVKIVLDLLPSTPSEAMENIWTVLVAVSQQPKFFENLIAERSLIQEMYKEVVEGGSKQIDLIAQLAFNLSLRPDLSSFLTPDLSEMFIEMLKTLFSNYGPAIKASALNTIINFSTYTPSSRVPLLGFDLISTLEDAGVDDPTMNVRYAMILNILSMEENLCIKLLEKGAQKLLVSIQGSISTMSPFVAQTEKKSRKRGNFVEVTGPTVPMIIDTELGRAITAATLHNLSLKRPVMGPGVLLTFMSFLKNCKTTRILHVARTLANVSTHARAKMTLAKEKRLIPLLTSTMRGGCEEADRVQHYCALCICNVLAVNIDKVIMEELCKTGAITDLVVCTLLRINSSLTKESLAKALFNLMSRADFRHEMAVKLEVMSAMLELAKIENVELLELCVRSIYNLTCEVPAYAVKMGELKVPNILVSRVSSSPNIAGAKSTTAVKFLCAMALANISFETSLVTELMFDKGLPNAAFCMFQLNSDEATYCAATMLSNMSKFGDVMNLADSCIIPLLISIVQRGPVTCTQMAVSTLTNFSVLPVFFDQLVEVAIGPLIQILAQPTMHHTIKADALQFIYNMTTLHEPSCVPAAMHEAAASLWKVSKALGSVVEGNEPTITRIGRIMKEICGQATTSETQKKLLSDGVMSILLKLSKIEIPALKLDLSFAIYSLSQGPEALKVLQWDGVDVLFWLSLHDCLNLYDAIRKNVSRAMRNFSSCGERGIGALTLAKEERSLTILRCMARSSNEDVQWQAAGVVYNILSVKEAQPDMLSRGVIQLLLDLAAGGYTGVRHVCSACLHLCPSENMPDLSDPAALQLVLCLLEVDGDKFALLGEKSNDMIPYTLPNVNRTSDYVADPTPFTASWVCIACEVDTIFSPALIPFPAGNYKELPPPRPNSAQTTLGKKHVPFNGSEFDYFGVREKNRVYEVDDDDNYQGDRPASTMDRGQADAGGDGGQSWQFNPVTAMDSREGSGDYYSPPAPESASTIAFPKIHQKKDVPQDTLGAIYKANKSGPKGTTSDIGGTMSINRHQNKSSSGTRNK